jgi:hypothetical protein
MSKNFLLATVIVLSAFTDTQSAQATSIGALTRGIRVCTYQASYLVTRPNAGSHCVCGLFACDLRMSAKTELRHRVLKSAPSQ